MQSSPFPLRQILKFLEDLALPRVEINGTGCLGEELAAAKGSWHMHRLRYQNPSLLAMNALPRRMRKRPQHRD